MIEKKTTIDQIEIVAGGVVQLRFGLLLVEDDVEIDRKWHRTVIASDTEVDAQMALVNEHLAAMSRNPVDTAGIAKIRAFVSLARAHG